MNRTHCPTALVVSILTALCLLGGCRLPAAPVSRPPMTAIRLAAGDRVLVLAPHPDDEVLGAGGVLREAVRRGLPTRVVFLTNGDSNEWSFLAWRKRPVILPQAVMAMGTLRRKEALAAAAILGVPAANVSFLGYPDYGTLAIWRDHWGDRPPGRGRLTRATAVPYETAFRPGAPFKGEEILADLETILRQFRPTRIFLSHPGDRHPDHAALYLFTRVALWDLQGKVAAIRHPFLIHYPHWPGEKGFHPTEELAPPAKLLAGFSWQTLELGREEINVKRLALAAHHTQFDYSASRLLPFVAANELSGDLDLPALVPGGEAVNLQDLAVRIVNQDLEITATLEHSLPQWSAVNLYAFGYRPGRLFGTMPKLAIRVGPDILSVRDQGHLLPRTTIEAHVTGTKLLVRLSLSVLGDPDRLFLHAETRMRANSLSQTPWWVLEMPSSPRSSLSRPAGGGWEREGWESEGSPPKGR
ncbi:MAG TPA: PIG-L family deacetylase [Thermoanaerobaculia bacterium]|nr:PIG-L family deacetylase [Thermoanaerobaculia bacterium]